MRTFLFLLFALTAFAQSAPVQAVVEFRQEASAGELMPIKMSTDRPTDKQCGPYFILVKSKNPSGVNGIMFFYAGNGHIANGIRIVDQKKVKTVIAQKKFPMVLTFSTKMSNMVVIFISQSDYEKTDGCLPPP